MTEPQRAVPASLIPDDITPEAAERIRWTLIGYTVAVEERNRYRGAWLSARRRARGLARVAGTVEAISEDVCQQAIALMDRPDGSFGGSLAGLANIYADGFNRVDDALKTEARSAQPDLEGTR